MEEIIKTPRLTLRPWTLEDVSDAFSIWGDHKIFQYVEGKPFASIEDATRDITNTIAHHGKKWNISLCYSI